MANHNRVLEPDFGAYQAEWSELEKSAENYYLPPFLPLIRELPVWVRDFPFYFSHDQLCFTHCPGYPFSREGMPSVFCRNGGFLVNDEWFATASQAVSRLAELLIDQHKLIFSGNVDHKAYLWLRNRLSPHIEGFCPTDRRPWFEREGRKYTIIWTDSEIGLEFLTDKQMTLSGSYSWSFDWEDAGQAVESWLLGQK